MTVSTGFFGKQSPRERRAFFETLRSASRGDATVQAQVDALDVLLDALIVSVTDISTLLLNLGKSCVAKGVGYTVALTSGAYVAVTLPTDEYDPNGWHSVATDTDRVIPTIHGLYQVNGYVQFDVTSSGTGRVALALTKNGTQFVREDLIQPSFTGPDLNVGSLVELDGSTDYVSMVAFHNTGAGKNVVDARLTVTLVKEL